jgi:flagellar assembly factor FliW
MVIVKSRSASLLECNLNNSQIVFNNEGIAGLDNTRNMAFNMQLSYFVFFIFGSAESSMIHKS